MRFYHVTRSFSAWIGLPSPRHARAWEDVLLKCSAMCWLQAKEVRPSQKMAAAAASSTAKQAQAEQRCIYAVSWQATDVSQGLPKAALHLGRQSDLANALVWKGANGWHKVNRSGSSAQTARYVCRKLK